MDDDLHSTVASRLRGVAQRYTRARRALVDVLASARRPLTAGEITAADRLAPMSTTYRNLAVLTQAGVLRRVDGVDYSRFELAEDLTEHHHHLVCLSCGHVDDFTLTASAEDSISKALQTVGASTGYRIEAHRLDALGRCRRCQ
jgi:Fe2+ or Zn2+ uptake regulation protein